MQIERIHLIVHVTNVHPTISYYLLKHAKQSEECTDSDLRTVHNSCVHGVFSSSAIENEEGNCHL